MTHLSVIVRWSGRVSNETLLPVRDGLVLGDAPGAAVPFPGTTLVVRRDRFGWTMGGHRLITGKRLGFDLGVVQVTVEACEAALPFRTLPGVLDLGLVVVVFALILLSGSVEAAGRIAARNPGLVEALQARLVGGGAVEQEPHAAPPELVDVVTVGFEQGDARR